MIFEMDDCEIKEYAEMIIFWKKYLKSTLLNTLQHSNISRVTYFNALLARSQDINATSIAEFYMPLNSFSKSPTIETIRSKCKVIDKLIRNYERATF